MTVVTVLDRKLSTFRLLAANRLTTLDAHDALLLLENSSSTPKLLYTLRCATCYKSDILSILSEYNNAIRCTLKVVLNMDLTDTAWSQATLPVSSGGLGIRLATDLALSAFLSSVNGAVELTQRLVPNRFHTVSDKLYLVNVATSLEWQTRCSI